MDTHKYTSLLDTLCAVPDPRKARGKQLAWSLILTLITGALAANARSGHAIARWVQDRATDLLAELQPEPARLPSESTLRRALRAIDLSSLEQHLAQFAQSLTTTAPADPASLSLSGQAIDGKELRGVRTHGVGVHLVSLVRHRDAIVLGQVAVAAKSNEIAAVPDLLAKRDLSGTVTTMDALLTQQAILRQIRSQNGDYLAVVKANQPELFEAIDRLFGDPPLPADQEEWRCGQTVSKGHGRLEIRTLDCSAELAEYLSEVWPDVRQVLRRTCVREVVKSGKTTSKIRYGITSLAPSVAGPRELEALWRGHWTIENCVHYVRDVTMGEDAGQAYRGNTPQAMAALRNGILNLLRRRGWKNMAEAFGHYAASVPRTLELIGARPARL
jgi:predicted transposase YbfD/YdcC